MSLQVVKIGKGTWRIQHLPSLEFFDAGGFAFKGKAIQWMNTIKPLANWDLLTVKAIIADKPNLLKDLRELAGIGMG